MLMIVAGHEVKSVDETLGGGVDGESRYMIRRWRRRIEEQKRRAEKRRDGRVKSYWLVWVPG